MDNPFSWGYLTTVPGTGEVFGPFAIIFLVIFGVGFLASVFLYNDGARLFTKHGLKRRTVRRGAGIAMVVFGIGLFFFGIRVLQINPFGFGMRIWLWMSFLAAVLMTVYFVYYLRTVYRDELQEYEDRKLKKQYLSATAAAIGGRRGNAAVLLEPRRPVKRRKR